MRSWGSISARCASLFLAALMVCPVDLVAGATSESGDTETLLLTTGEQLQGQSLGFEGTALRFRLPDGGVILVPLESIESLTVTPESSPEPATGESEQAEHPAPEQSPAGGESPQAKSEPDPPAEASAASQDGTTSESGEVAGEKEAKKDPHVSPAYAVEPIFEEPLPLTNAWYEAARSTLVFTVDEADAWTKRLELGGSWVEGNSDTSTVYVGGKFEREFEHVYYQFDWSGRRSTADEVLTQSRWQINGTTDFFREKDSKWILFGTHKHLFDQMADLDYRGTFASGIGYRVFNEKKRELTFRVGPGTTVEKYDPPIDDRITFDVFSQVEARWPIWDRTFLEYKSTFTPSVYDLGVFRVVSKTGLLVALDESENWAMKIGLQHFYNSDPNPGLVKNDFTTTFSIVYSRD